MILSTPPQHDEFEISLLGSGYGESIVIHFGQGQWGIVDSCFFKESHQQPAAMQYLEAIGQNANDAVQIVVATHWDDDHIRGLSNIVKNYPYAKFVMSAAINDTKFRRVLLDSPLSRAMRLDPKTSTGLNEFHNIFYHLRDSERKPDYASNNKLLWMNNRGMSVEVYSLSPSSEVFEQSLQAIISQIPPSESTEPVVRLNPPATNHTSVVLWLKLGEERVLLGADMEEKAEFRGWTTIINDGLCIDGKAGLYKVAHHGSKTGDHEAIWSKLLITNPCCLISPWRRGGKMLPNFADLKRIGQQSENVHLSYSGSGEKKAKRNHVGAVNRALRGINAKAIVNNFSMVRCRRRNEDSEWKVEHHGDATKVNPPATD